MGRPKRNLLATAAEASTPPDKLQEGQHIARVEKAAGNNLYAVTLPSTEQEQQEQQGQLLVELPTRFRSALWIKRGGYVIIDTTALADRSNKLNGEIVTVIMDEKEWRKQSYWLS